MLVLAPFPPSRVGVHGGARATGFFLERLAARMDVGLLCLRGSNDGPLDEALAGRLAHAEEVPLERPSALRALRIGGIAADYAGLATGRPSWVRAVRSRTFAERVRRFAASWRPDVVQLEYPVMGQYLEGLGQTRAQRVLVEHDVAVAAAREAARSAAGWRKIRLTGELMAWKRYEGRVLDEVHAVVVFTHRDAAEVRALRPGCRVEVIPLGADVRPRADPPPQSPPTLLFVGSFVHDPNVDAADRLARGIFPQLRSQFPDLVLDIVGHAPPPHIFALRAPGIAVHGDVPDVAPYLERAAVVVVPVRHGGGMRVKVLEALAAGKPIVASQRAIAGLALVAGEHVLVAETDDDFAAATAALLRDPDRRKMLGAAAYEWAGRELSWDRSAARFEQLYRELTSSAGAPVRRA